MNGPNILGGGANVWDGWRDDMNTIQDSVNALLDSTNINLSSRQLDLIQSLLKSSQKVYWVFDTGVTSQKFDPNWRDTVTGIAVTVIKIIKDARAGLAAYKAGKNPSQESILDSKSINYLVKAVRATQKVYAKLDAYSRSILASHDAKEIVSPKLKRNKAAAVVVFG